MRMLRVVGVLAIVVGVLAIVVAGVFITQPYPQATGIFPRSCRAQTRPRTRRHQTPTGSPRLS